MPQEANPSAARKPVEPKNKEVIFVAAYTHYRTGKVMRARDYGYNAWPIPCRRKA